VFSGDTPGDQKLFAEAGKKAMTRLARRVELGVEISYALRQRGAGRPEDLIRPEGFGSPASAGKPAGVVR
jgi:hypothetical protein